MNSTIQESISPTYIISSSKICDNTFYQLQLLRYSITRCTSQLQYNGSIPRGRQINNATNDALLKSPYTILSVIHQIPSLERPPMKPENSNIKLSMNKLKWNHLLDIDNYNSEQIQSVFTCTDQMLKILRSNNKKTDQLRGKTIILLFYEPSTRTRVSFEQAGKILGADVLNIVTKGSSAEKGESLKNTALTLQAMNADLIVIRHPHSGAPWALAKLLNQTKVINAGDGTHAHPTQALLDLYTIKSHFGHLKNLNVTIIGDILHSRVARSNILGLSAMGANITICAPSTLLPVGVRNKTKKLFHVPFKDINIQTNISKALQNANVVMPLRIQAERQNLGLLPSLREYSSRFGLSKELLKLADPNAIVMHPGPMNEGIEIASDIAHSDRSFIQKQVENGVAIRMALLSKIINAHE